MPLQILPVGNEKASHLCATPTDSPDDSQLHNISVDTINRNHTEAFMHGEELQAYVHYSFLNQRCLAYFMYFYVSPSTQTIAVL